MIVRASTTLAGSEPEHNLGSTRRTLFEAEAPERGENRREAPETWVDQLAEAPDAGEGRTESGDNEFKQGRSQS
jgi:hypothetical protein